MPNVERVVSLKRGKTLRDIPGGSDSTLAQLLESIEGVLVTWEGMSRSVATIEVSEEGLQRVEEKMGDACHIVPRIKGHTIAAV